MPARKQVTVPSPSYRYGQIEHFLGSSTLGFGTGITNTGSGTGAGLTQNAGQANSPGTVRMTTGATTTGNWALRYPSTMAPPGSTGNQNLRVGFRWRAPSLVSGTDGCFIVMGFGDGAGGMTSEPSSGAYLYIDSGSGLILFTASNNLTRTRVASASNYTPNVWLESSIMLARDGTAKFSTQLVEDGVFTTAVISTNIPTASVGVLAGISKNAGLTTRTLDLDYISLSLDREAPISSVY